MCSWSHDTSFHLIVLLVVFLMVLTALLFKLGSPFSLFAVAHVAAPWHLLALPDTSLLQLALPNAAPYCIASLLLLVLPDATLWHSLVPCSAASLVAFPYHSLLSYDRPLG